MPLGPLLAEHRHPEGPADQEPHCTPEISCVVSGALLPLGVRRDRPPLLTDLLGNEIGTLTRFSGPECLREQLPLTHRQLGLLGRFLGGTPFLSHHMLSYQQGGSIT